MVVIRSRGIPVNNDTSSPTPFETETIPSAHGYTRLITGGTKRQRHSFFLWTMGDKLERSLTTIRVEPPARRFAHKATRLQGVFAEKSASGLSH